MFQLKPNHGPLGYILLRMHILAAKRHTVWNSRMLKQLSTIIIFVLTTLVVACSPTKSTPQQEISTETRSVEISSTATSTSSPIPPTPTPTVTVTPSKTPTPTPTIDLSEVYPEEGFGPSNFPDNINPLTGLPVGDQNKLERRPIAVKISNYPRGIRPQWGLSFADLVYEYYHEAGLTRFFALYYGTDVSEAGPIRSARFTDIPLVRMYKAIFAFGSGDYRVRNSLYSSEFANRLASISDRPCPPSEELPLCRTDPDGWNHLLTNTQLLSQHITNQGVPNNRQNLDGMHFNLTSPSGGEQGELINVHYSIGDYHRWEYDPDLRKYLRYQDASTGDEENYTLLTDRINDQPITADNVVLLFARHEYYLREPEIFEITLTGFGKAYLFRNGNAYDVNWARVNAGELISLTYDDGTRFPMKPGNTWIDVVGLNTQFTQDEAIWRFEFRIP